MIVEPDFPDHWKTRLLVELLGGDEAGPVYLLRLWAHCQSRKQWIFESLSSTSLKGLCRYPGHSNKLESSLATSGFIRRDDVGVLTVHQWDEYNAQLVASWKNGSKGGRPKNPRKPKSNPSQTEPSYLISSSKRFIIPTLEEVRAYCAERKNSIDPELFMDHYTANGWVQGRQGKPVQDWRACVRTWEKSGFQRSGANGRDRSEDLFASSRRFVERGES